MDISTLLPFQVFGSHDSTDYDVMLFVDDILDPHHSKMRCNAADKELYQLLSSFGWQIKPLNTNLAIVVDGIVTKVFKGYCDEVQNSLLLTYDFHQQRYPLQVTKLVERDVDQKILRTFRVILSFISRTAHRVAVKQALHSDLVAKLAVVSEIPITGIMELGKGGIAMVDYHKTLAFQFGQTLGLMDGVELYTKKDIATHFPLIRDFLYRREAANVQILDDMQIELIARVKERLPFMTKLVE